jgi:peptidylprolyl isomerase
MKRFVIPAVALLALALVIAACGGDGGDETGDNGTPADESTPSADAAPAVSFAEACQKSEEKQFAEAPPRIIDTGKTYVATIRTEKGDIVVELFSDVPITTNNFVFLACKGF